MHDTVNRNQWEKQGRWPAGFDSNQVFQHPHVGHPPMPTWPTQHDARVYAAKVARWATLRWIPVNYYTEEELDDGWKAYDQMQQAVETLEHTHIDTACLTSSFISPSNLKRVDILTNMSKKIVSNSPFSKNLLAPGSLIDTSCMELATIQVTSVMQSLSSSGLQLETLVIDRLFCSFDDSPRLICTPQNDENIDCYRSVFSNLKRLRLMFLPQYYERDWDYEEIAINDILLMPQNLHYLALSIPRHEAHAKSPVDGATTIDLGFYLQHRPPNLTELCLQGWDCKGHVLLEFLKGCTSTLRILRLEDIVLTSPLDIGTWKEVYPLFKEFLQLEFLEVKGDLISRSDDYGNDGSRLAEHLRMKDLCPGPQNITLGAALVSWYFSGGDYPLENWPLTNDKEILRDSVLDRVSCKDRNDCNALGGFPKWPAFGHLKVSGSFHRNRFK